MIRKKPPALPEIGQVRVLKTFSSLVSGNVRSHY